MEHMYIRTSVFSAVIHSPFFENLGIIKKKKLATQPGLNAVAFGISGTNPVGFGSSGTNPVFFGSNGTNPVPFGSCGVKIVVIGSMEAIAVSGNSRAGVVVLFPLF